MNKHGWTYSEFEDCVNKVKYPQKVKTNDYLPTGLFPVVSQEQEYISGYNDDGSKVFHHTKPVVVFGDHSRVVKYIDFDFIVGADGVKILDVKDFLIPKFFYYHIRWIDVPSLGYSRHYKSLKENRIPIPPVAEQEAIVAELDAISETITELQLQVADLDALAQSTFYTMFGDPVTNEKGWDVKKLGDIGSFQRGGTMQKKDFIEDGFPCIHYGQLHTRFGAFTTTHLTCVPKELYHNSKIAHKNDLILALTSEDVEGSCKSTAWMGEYDVAIGSDAAIFTHNQNAIYLSYYTRTQAFYNEKQKYAHGFKVTHIKTNDIARFPIPLPPLALQQEFASRVEAIEGAKAELNAQIAEMQTLLAARMDYWFD